MSGWIGVRWTPTLAVGERAPLRLDANGALVVSGGSGGGAVTGTKQVDEEHAMPPSPDALDTRAHGYGWCAADAEWVADPCMRQAGDFTTWPFPTRAPVTLALMAGYSTVPGLLWSASGINLTATSANINSTLCLASVTYGRTSTVIGTVEPVLCTDNAQHELCHGLDYDGDVVALVTNSAGKTVTMPGLPDVLDTEDAPRLHASLAVVDVEVVDTTPVWLLSLQVSWLATGTGIPTSLYLQLFDRTTVPVSGVTVPQMSLIFSLGALLQVSRSDLAGTGLRFGSGLVWALSRTPGVYTGFATVDYVPLALVHMELSP